MKQPTWLPRVVLDAAHLDQLREHGGLAGLRDENALEAALARPLQRWNCGAPADLAEFAAAYAYGIAASHPYRDGNKRAAFLALAIFLELNGYECNAPEDEVVTVMVALAAGSLGEPALAVWVRHHSTKVPR